MKYVVVLERSEGDCSAYSPDVLGGIPTGRTAALTPKCYRTAAGMYFAGLKEDGLSLPRPNARTSTVEVKFQGED